MTQKIVQCTVHNASACKVYIKYYTTRIKNLKSRNTKKKKKTVTNDSPEEILAQRRIHHTEAIERNKSLYDRHPTCPTAQLLVLHITKSHVTIPHIYRFLLPTHSTRFLKTFHFLSQLTQFSLSLSFMISIYFQLFLSFFSFYFWLFQYIISSHILYPTAFRRALGFCLLNLWAVVGHKINTEIKCVRWFSWWCACTCMAALLVSSGPSLPLLPSLSCIVLLPMMLLRN